MKVNRRWWCNRWFSDEARSILPEKSSKLLPQTLSRSQWKNLNSLEHSNSSSGHPPNSFLAYRLGTTNALRKFPVFTEAKRRSMPQGTYWRLSTLHPNMGTTAYRVSQTHACFHILKICPPPARPRIPSRSLYKDFLEGFKQCRCTQEFGRSHHDFTFGHAIIGLVTADAMHRWACTSNDR